MVTNTLAGAVATDETKLRAAARRFQTLYSVVLPSAVPHIVTCALLALGNSFLAIVFAEMEAADQRLRVLIWTSRNYGRIDWTLVGITTPGITWFFFDRTLRLLVKPLAKNKAEIEQG